MAAARTVPITDVVVTYGDSMAPPGYHRITGDSKMGVDVNKLAGGPPTYLWLREEKGAPAITGIDIVYEDEEAPEGFEKLAKNLARGSGTRAYLCTRKQPKQDAGAGAGAGGGGDDGGGDGGAGPEVEGDGGAAPAPLPLDRVAVLFEAEPAAEGFETLDKPLLRAEGAAPVRLCFSRCTEADLQASGKEWSAHQLKEGDWVDALDTVQTWRVAQVIELEEERVKVHFKNWGARWDRWCRKGGRELAELASHTAGKDTGWSQRAAGAAWAVSAADVDGMIEQLRAASTGQLPPQEADALLRADVPHFVEACLSSTFTDPQMAKGVRINGFLQEVLVAFARDLRTPAPVSGAMLTMCGRIYCLEKAYTWFYKNHGHDFYDPEPEDPPVAGPVAVAGGDGADGAPLSPTAAAPPPPPSPAQPPPPPPPMDYVHQKRDASGAIPVPVSRFFLQNFNKLGMEKGYEAFVARLGGLPLPQGAAAKGAAKGEGSQEKEGAKFFMPIEEVTQICNMIKLPCTHYVPKFGAAYFPRLHAAMLEYVRTLTEERVKEVTPAKLGEFMRVVDKLFESTLTPKAAAAEATETLSLEVARRLLFFPSLQLQLRGAARLRELCDMTDRKDHPQRYRTNVSYYGYQAIGSSGSGYGRTRPDPVAVWLTGAELTRWLVENEVAELMLGDTDVLTKHKLQAPHIEILRRSEIVLQHLSQQKLLTVKHLQLLWEQSKVDGNAPVVHDLVTKTCRGWTLEQVDFLFDKVKDIGVGEYCDETIQMVKTITRYSIIRHKHLEDQPVADGEERPPEKQRWLGLKFLWAVAFSDAAVEATIKLSALAAIAELLGTPFCKPVRAEYFEQCVNNVCESSHVESSLRLLQLVAEKQDENRYSYNHSDAVSEADNILLQLESDHGLLRLLVREATRFTRNEAGLALPALRDAVKSRLAFLEYYLSHTPHLTLQLEQAVLLWDCLVAKDDGRGFSELFFDWLSDLLPKYTNSYGEVAMLDETIQEVFDQLLCSAERMGDFVKLGERGFMCFHIYFRRVNGTQQRMREPMHAQYCSVSDFDLSGLDSLWAIMMNVENTDVALAAIQFLVHLFTNFAQPQAPKRDIWSSHFLQPCMKRVATAAHALAQAPSDAASDRQIQRILMLLRIFVDKVENSTPDYKRNESGVRVMVRKSASGGVLRDRTFILQRTATVGELRQRIADDLKVRGDRVRLTNMRRIDLDVAQHNVLTLERAQIFNHCDAVLLDAPEDDTRGHEPPPKGPLTPAEEDRRYPCETLSNTPDYFNLLFKLLELSPEVQEKAWELLQLLPVNKRMDEELKTLNGKVCKSPTNASAKGMVVDGEVPWAQLLDEDSALKLLYQLQIVEGQLGLGAADNAEQWHECFLQAGGFGHLYRIFMAFDPVKMTSGPLLKACLAKLISLVSIFLCASEDIAEAPGHAWFSPLVLSDFVTQLLVVLKANVASSNPSRPLAVVDVEDSDSDLDDNTSTIPQAEADVARHTIVSLQLFMVPRLRHGILTLPDDEEEGEKAESMMYQLQTMFANLQESEKQCYNPQPFCHAFKDWEGAPVDVLVQQDIHEFLTNFFQQVENNLSEMSKKEAEILKNTVGGSFCHELIADGGRYSAREEPFYFWSVNIKGCKDLGQAMEKEMEGETVEYTWEEKQEDGSEKKTKLNTKKRMSLKTLPDHLFIHLKRFEMDFETMQQVKINDKLEFPHDLDMLSYTVEGRAQQEAQAKAAAAEAGEEDGEAAVDGGGVPQEGEQDEGGEESKEEADSGKPQQPEIKSPEHYKYELAGVVVHMGVANSGHYYSYIKDRNACGKSAKWFEFNDELVCPFDPSQIESECFGGEETFQGYGNHGGGVSTYGGTQGYSREKIRNAFVLVYDRVQAKPEPTTPAARAASATPTREVLAAPVMASEAPKAPASPLQRRNSRRHSSMLASRAPVPPAIFERIWKANTDFWQRANVTDSSYMQFMAHFVSEGSIRANSDSVGEARLLSTGFRFLLTLSRSFSRQDAPLMQKLAQSLQILYAGNDEACEVLLRSLATTPSLCALEEIFLEFEQPAVRQAIAGVCVVCMRNVLKRTPIVSFESGKMENVALMFVDALIQHLPSARAHWQQNSSEYCWMLVQFCTVLLEDEEARVEARRYFIEQGVLRLVIHCTVGSESPHQELSSAAEPGIATVATGTADVPVSSDYASLLELIHLLMVSCIPTIPAQEIEQVGGIQTMPPTLQPPSLAMHEFSRMAYALKEVFGVMHEMRQYADATYVSINCVLKLASTKPRILNWMTQEANHSAWNWIEAWLRLKEKQASSTYNTATYGYPSQMPSANLIRARKMLAHVHDFLESRPVQVRLYDESDDPRTLIGRDVIIETQRARLDATVVDYDDATGLHTVVADGVDYTYNLLDQHFLFVEQHVPSDDDDDSEEDAVGTSSDEPYVAGHERPASP
eukprot:g2109.t1